MYTFKFYGAIKTDSFHSSHDGVISSFLWKNDLFVYFLYKKSFSNGIIQELHAPLFLLNCVFKVATVFMDGHYYYFCDLNICSLSVLLRLEISSMLKAQAHTRSMINELYMLGYLDKRIGLQVIEASNLITTCCPFYQYLLVIL